MTDSDSRASRAACLANAEALVSLAERELGKGIDHICFHLALLALEEIGKSILATVSYTSSLAGKPKEILAVAMDDHVKKIFWALWGPGMMRREEITREKIEQNRNLAVGLHEKRLLSLYTDVANPSDPKDRIDENEASNLVRFTRPRLEIEKSYELIELKEDDVEVLTWFFKATDDPERRKEIFSRKSLDKLAELKNGPEWMKWLQGVYQAQEDEMRKLAERELRRPRPADADQMKPKYRMRVRIQTISHSVRNNAFVKWNSGVNDIKMYKSDKKDPKGLTKGEVLIDFTFPLALPPSALWDHGMFMSHTMVIAMNIATRGIFWWHVQKDVEKYYEEISDLEVDPRGGVMIRVAPAKRLLVDFDDARLVLDEQEMGRVEIVAGFIFRNAGPLEQCLRHYALGLTFFSKTDIHLRLEANAFEEFYNAMKCAMKALGDWDGTSEFKVHAKKAYERIGEMKELDGTLDHGSELDADPRKERPHGAITLTEVVAIKLYCDYYLQHKAREYFEKYREEQEAPPDGATDTQAG